MLILHTPEGERVLVNGILGEVCSLEILEGDMLIGLDGEA